MDIKYGNILVDSQVLSKSQVQLEADVWLNVPVNSIYSLIMVDLDAPPYRTDSNNVFLHWWIANIDLSRNFNQTWADYFPPTPPLGSGKHRYVFYLYKQPKFIVKPWEFNSITGRANFDLYTNSNKLGFLLLEMRQFVVPS